MATKTKLQIRSFFGGDWKDSNFDDFIRLVKPKDNIELTNMKKAMMMGAAVLSAAGTFKFRMIRVEKDTLVTTR